MVPRSFAAFAAALPFCLLGLSAHAAPAAATLVATQNSSGEATPASTEATIDFSLKEVGGGLGYEWGKGVLHYNGKTYAFEIGGGGIASLGYISVQGTGQVKDLTRLDHFDGTYWTVKADAAVGSGVGAAVLENQYGVKLDLNMTIKGAHLGASVMRLRFRLLPETTGQTGNAAPTEKTEKAVAQ